MKPPALVTGRPQRSGCPAMVEMHRDAMLDYFSKDPIFRKYAHKDLTFSMWYAYSENYLLPLSLRQTGVRPVDEDPRQNEQRQVGQVEKPLHHFLTKGLVSRGLAASSKKRFWSSAVTASFLTERIISTSAPVSASSRALPNSAFPALPSPR